MYKSVCVHVCICVCVVQVGLGPKTESVGPTGLEPTRLNAGGSDLDLALRQLQDQTQVHLVAPDGLASCPSSQ